MEQVIKLLKILKNILKYKYLILILIILFSFIRTKINNNSKYNINETIFEGTIIDYKENKDYITFTLKGKEKIKCNYYYKDKEIINLNYGD